MQSGLDLTGTEFDWFATDQEGNFALFATAGAGPVPGQVLEIAEQHDALKEDIPVSGWGTNDVWKSYAQVGLFAYDWHDALNSYVRVARPSAPLDHQLGDKLRASLLPRLSVLFQASENVQLQ